MTPLQLTVLVPEEDIEEVRDALASAQINAVRADSEGFDGTALAQLLVTLTTAAIPALVTMYKARVAANKSIRYKSQDFEVQGVSDSTLTKIVELHERRNTES